MIEKIEENEQCKKEIISKYHKLNIPYDVEMKLRQEYAKTKKPIDMEKFKEELKINGDYSYFRDGISEIWNTETRAYLVFKLCSNGGNASVLCNLYGVSGGYYRELKRTHLTEWKELLREDNEYGFMEAIVNANDTGISDNEYIDRYGAEHQRHDLMLSGGGDW